MILDAFISCSLDAERCPMDALKPHARDWTIKEQIIRDPVSGLTLQFDVGSDGSPRLRIFGVSLPHGNREIGFAHDGQREWSSIAVSACPNAGWMTGKV